MKVKKSTAFLCGSFSFTETKELKRILSDEWSKICKTPEDFKILRSIYYPEFVDFCFPSDDKKSAKKMQRYELKKGIEDIGENGNHVLVKTIQLVLCPFKQLIYVIEIEQNNIDSNELITSLKNLREISKIQNEKFKGVLNHIVEIYNTSNKQKITGNDNDYSPLIENGNKLKFFHIFNVEPDLNQDDKNRLLFELGTLSSDNLNLSKYYENIMNNNKISIYNDWAGLALLDTYSIICYEENTPISYTGPFYFEMIYLHLLFLKNYLFNVNQRFWQKKSNATQFEKEFLDFECNCCFHNISYNFLPLEIAKNINNGMEIEYERKNLFRLIKQEKDIRENVKTSHLNRLVVGLTCLTALSVLLDINLLVKLLLPTGTWSEPELPRFVSTLFVVVLIAMVALIFKIGTRLKK